jgi:hypothetical protein
MSNENIKSAMNTYNNAMLLRRYLLSDYIKSRIDTKELIKGIQMCEILIITNALIINKNGRMDESR